MQFRETVDVYCENNMKDKYTVLAECRVLAGGACSNH
jgi:hypothetical protein